jgi:hypothetical protein
VVPAAKVAQALAAGCAQRPIGQFGAHQRWLRCAPQTAPV